MSTAPCPSNCVRVTNNICECTGVIGSPPSPRLSSTSPSPGPCPSNCVRVNNICECTGVIGLPSPMLSSTSPSPSPSTPWYKNTYIIIGIVLVILLFLTGSGVLAIYLSKSKSTTKSK